MSRPYPVLPPARQKKQICETPIPNSIKKTVATFNKRAFWSWGANLVERNCVPQDTIIPKPPPPPPQYVYTFSGNGNAGYDDGPNGISTLAFPQGVAVDVHNNVYVADTANHSIRKITPTGFMTTIAGNGYAGNVNNTNPRFATFNNPTGLALDSAGNIFVSDSSNNVIRKINTSGYVTTFVGSGLSGFTDGTGTSASFWFPTDIHIDGSDNIYIADTQNHAIRVCTSLGVVTTLAGNGYQGYVDGSTQMISGNTSLVAEFAYPSSALMIFGNVYVADTGNDCIRVVSNNTVSTLAFTPSPGGLTYDTSTLVVTSETENIITRVSLNGRTELFAGTTIFGLSDGLTLSASFSFPRRIAYNNSLYYVADMFNNSIRRISYDTNPTVHVLTSSSTSPFIITDVSAGIVTYSMIGGGGGGDVSGGGAGAGSSFATYIFSGASNGTAIQFNIGRGGSGGNRNTGQPPSDGGNTTVIIPDYGIISVSGGNSAGVKTLVSGNIIYTNGKKGGDGSYGGGGGINGSGGIGTIDSGKDGNSSRGGNGGGDPDSGKGDIRGGGGGGHGGGSGNIGSSNATFYGAGGGGVINTDRGGNGGDGAIVITIY